MTDEPPNNLIRVDFRSQRRPDAPSDSVTSVSEGMEEDCVSQDVQSDAGFFSAAEVARVLHVPVRRVASWSRLGLLGTGEGTGSTQTFSFKDMVALRVARDLTERGVSIKEVRAAVIALRRTAPEVAEPLSEMRFTSDGSHVVVRSEHGLFEPRSGQFLLGFEDAEGAVVRALGRPQGDESRARLAYEHYLEGCQLDESVDTLDQAEACYRQAVELDPTLANALTNLGNLRFRRGDSGEAESFYRRALEVDPEQPEAAYNLGFLCFEGGDPEEAVGFFSLAIELDPCFADAHFNLAMVLEESGRTEDARPHWEYYLRLDPEGPWAEIARRHLSA